MTGRATVVLVGLDTAHGQRWTWRWHDDASWSPPHALDARAVRRVADLLAAGIPGRVSGADVPTLGPLAMPDSERDWSQRLGELLLHPRLARQIVARASEGVRFAVLPSQSTSAVPWELLPVDAERDLRLLEVADIVHVAPPVPRDARSATRWEDVRHLPALHLVDPDLTALGMGQVLTESARQALQAGHPGPGGRRREQGSLFGVRADRRWLSAALPNRSRFFFVGHLVPGHRDEAESTGLLLGCRRSDYSADDEPMSGGVRPWTARDLVRGTLDVDVLVEDPGLCRRLFGIPWMGRSEVPRAAWDEEAGRVCPVPGAKLWPMPPRVALLGCRSGPDASYAEPFGLISAILGAGAELVTATRWTMYTARTLERWGCQGDPLGDLAHTVDGAHAGADPASRIATWQRVQLDRFRLRPGHLVHTPLIWSALITLEAPASPAHLLPLVQRQRVHGPKSPGAC